MIDKTHDTFSEEPPLVDQLIWSRDNAAGVTLAQDEVEDLCDIIRNLEARADSDQSEYEELLRENKRQAQRIKDLEAERDAAVMDEREACAALCETIYQKTPFKFELATTAAAIIRARSNKEDG